MWKGKLPSFLTGDTEEYLQDMKKILKQDTKCIKNKGKSDNFRHIICLWKDMRDWKDKPWRRYW